MHWIGMAIALSSALLSTGLGRSHIRHYYPTLNDTLFDVVLIVVIVVGLGLSTIKHYIDQNEIKNLEEDVDLIKYQEVSLYGPKGVKAGLLINGIPTVRTPIDDWNKEYVHYGKGGKVIFQCQEGAKEVCLKVIDKIPEYPFSYLFLAQCLKEENESSWIEVAQKAKEILKKTTKMPGHNTSHDTALKEVADLLKAEIVN